MWHSPASLELAFSVVLKIFTNREMTLGGYSQQITLFHPLPSKKEEGDVGIAPFPVLVFVASPNSGPYWLGPASSCEIAQQVFVQFSMILTILDMSRLCQVRVQVGTTWSMC